MKNYLWRRLGRILTGEDISPTYASISPRERQDLLEILKETKPEFAAWLRDRRPLGSARTGRVLASQ
jgi:hypothetical protein